MTSRFHSAQTYRGIKAATRMLVRDAGGLELAAKVTRVERAALSRYENPAAEQFLPVDVLLDLEAANGEAHVTRYLARAQGHVLIELPKLDGTGEWGEHLGAIAKECGEAISVVGAALSAGGNAALAMNLLAAEDVVWLRPDPPQQEGGSGLWQLLPLGLRWSLVPLVAALALLALWQGRRMGALVPESLPVVVRASETTEGRAGLYQSRRARDRVAAALRSGFVDRVAPKLGLGADAAPDTVVAAVASRTGDDPAHLRALLHPGHPDPYAGDDDMLVRLADELDERARRLR